MSREVRRDLMIAIDSLALTLDDTRTQFYRHGYREFFGHDYAAGDGAKGVLIDFIRYFCFDAGDGGARFNGFQKPWIVLTTLCRNPHYSVRLRDEASFCAGLRELVKGDTAWTAFEAFLDAELIAHGGRAGSRAAGPPAARP